MVTNKNNSTANDYAPDFELPGIDGQVHHLTRYLEKFKAIAIVFINDRSPYVNKYLERLNSIQAEFEEQSFMTIAINATDIDTTSEDILKLMKDFASQHDLNYPYLRDSNQDVARCFGVTIIPEAFVIDKTGKICYAGAIDDSPDTPESVNKAYLHDSIAAVLAGKKVEIDRTKAVGSEIRWRK